MRITDIVVCVALAAGPLTAADELPERHRRVQEWGDWATVVAGDPAGVGHPELSVSVGYDAVLQRVDLRWIAASEWWQTMRDEHVAVDYHPLAVAGESPLDDVLYVIGWDAETDMSLVERWTFSAARPRVVGRDVLDEPVHEFEFPERHVEEIARWPGQLTYEAVFHPSARELLILCDATPDGTRRQLLALGVDEPVDPAPRFDRDEIPSIDTAVWMNVGVTTEGGRVYVFVMPAFGNGQIGVRSSDDLRTHVIVDADRDGHFEENWSGQVDDVAEQMAAIEWTREYHADLPPDAR